MKLRSGTSLNVEESNSSTQLSKTPRRRERPKHASKSPSKKNMSKFRLENDTPPRSESTRNHETNGYLINNNSARSRQHTAKTDDLIPHSESALLVLKLGCWFLISMYFLIPAFIKLNPWIMAEMAFLHRVRWPPFLDLNDTSKLGLNYTRSFRLRSDEGHSMGVWHVLPRGLANEEEQLTQLNYVASLNSGHPIVLYSHGQAGTRAAWHRVALYKQLARAGFHVIAYDYRGYGDSEGYPSEAGVVEDSYTVFRWIKEHSGNASVYLWGHSMGTGVTTQLAQRLCNEKKPPAAVILEAPFTNLLEAAASYPLTIPFTYMPWYAWVFVESIQYNNISFQNDESIRHITAPILVLHAEDDGMVRYRMGHKLYEIGKETGRNIQMHSFDSAHGYGHKHIHKAPELMSVVKKFTEGQDVHNSP